MKYKLSLLGLVGLALNAQSEDLQTSKINVYSPGPLPSIGISTDIIPGYVNVVKPEDVNRQPGVTLSDYLVNNAQGFSLTEVGGNPWQPDLQFRGYSAGSILGNPIGLSVYVDGVRENQPFSDVMLWDTVPMWAMSGTQVVAGSNPIYGLNTLGGALALQTKNGKLFNKGRISATAGSWDRTAGLIEYGGVLDGSNIDYYFGYNHTSENGWRDYSPSHLNQAFAKLGKDFENGRVELSYTGASNNLIGNGLVPGFMLGADNTDVNTVPDLTENRYHKLNLGLTQFIDETTMFSANAYYVSSNRYTLNGDAEIDGVVVDGVETDTIKEVEGEIRTTKTKQDKYGVSAQLTLSDDLFGKKNHLVMGSVLETSLIGFKQGEYEGTLLDNRRITVRDPDYEAATYLSGRTKTFGVYAVDTLSLNDQWHVTGGLRYNYTQVDNSDRLNGDAVEETLTAKQGWGRINPTVGVTYKPSDNYSTYVNYSESNRAPTSIELGCSNPAAACTLPTQMADDPPLRDVVAKTYEAGARGNLANGLTWNVSAYHSYNHDDLQFINSSATTGQGYFDNIGRTRRDGIDVGLAGKGLFNLADISDLSWNASYGFVHATFDSDLNLPNEVNTSADGVFDDGIQVKKGDLLTNIPMHRLKLRLNYEVNDKFRVGTNLVGFSKSYMLGNENQKHNGDGEVPGYFILNMDANYKVAPKWNLALKAINLLDQDYYTGGRLVQNGFTGNGNETRAGANAYSGSAVLPGAPRAAWVTLSYDFK